MTMITRRHLLAAGSALAGLSVLPVSAFAVDIAEFNKAPDLGEMSLGAEESKVTLTEYASATCPHCAAFHSETYGKLKAEYIDSKKIKFVFREFPHQPAAVAAFMLARCAPKEKYFPLIDVFFTTQPEWTQDPLAGLGKIAQQAGFTKESFDACMKNEAVAKDILAVRTKAEGFGVTGIPTFFVNGERYQGENTIEAFRAKIDPLLM